MAKQVGNPNLGVHLKGLRLRSAHLGFDCYVSGPVIDRHLSCKFRRHRAPPRMTADLIDMIPSEFSWPTASHEEAHRAIDAIYTLDVPTLRGYVRQYPEHHFGFEHFIERAERWHAAARRHGAADVAEARAVAAEAPAGHGVAPGRVIKPGGPVFPGWVKHAVPITPVEVEPYTLRLAIIYFSNGMPALRIDVYPVGEGPGRDVRLSRIYADLVSNRHDVIEHFPGKYLALGLDPLAMRKILGVTRLTNQRRTAYDHPDVLAARERARERARSHPSGLQVLRESRAMQVAADPSGDPDQVFGAHLLPAGVAR